MGLVHGMQPASKHGTPTVPLGFALTGWESLGFNVHSTHPHAAPNPNDSCARIQCVHIPVLLGAGEKRDRESLTVFYGPFFGQCTELCSNTESVLWLKAKQLW